MKKQKFQAKNLYFQTDLSRSEIAEKVGASRTNIHFWIRQNNWDRQKQAAAHMPAMLAENVYYVIGRFTQQLMDEDRIMRPVTRHEADTLHKLTMTLNKLKNRSTLNESMEMFGIFMESVHDRNPELAQQIMPFVEEYIDNRSAINIAQFRYTPPLKEDVRETQLDIADIMAWTEGPGIIPDAEEQIEKLTTAEPLPKATAPAGVNHHIAKAPQNDETTEGILAEMDRLFAGLPSETRSRITKFAHEAITENRPKAA